MNRRSFLASLGVAATMKAADRPNVVLILADDLGFECLSGNGSTSYKTPNLDKLAAEGVKFTHAYAQPLCTPTRLQLMTGQHNFRNWMAFGLMNPKERTFGHMMQDAGYKTVIAGKWQFWSYDGPGESERRGKGKRIQDAGFDEYSVWHAWHTEDKGSRYANPVIFEDGRIRPDTKGKYGEDLWLDFLGRFMERHRNEPFFAYYPMALTHGPFNLTPGSTDWESGDRLKDDPKNYADMVEYMDGCVGRLLAKIDGLGLRSKTLVLFYADNGTPREIKSSWKGKPVQGGKGLTTNLGMHVPLIASWPGVAKAGSVCRDLVDSTDFIPTICEATGVKKLPGAVDGRSFLPQIKGEKGSPREALFSHYDPHPGCKVDYKPTRFAWDHQWKLYMDGRLFDYVADPDEKKPVEGQPEVRKKLQSVLDEMAKANPPVFNKFSAYGKAY